MLRSLKLGWFAFFLMALFLFPIKTFASDEVKVAFIRDHNLWMKVGTQEKQLTRGEYVSYPKWSYDGQWIAYTKGQEEKEIGLYHVADQKHMEPFSGDGQNYQWAPDKNRLAFQSDGILKVMDVSKLKVGFENVALGVDDYGWLPDGNGFIAATLANPTPMGWGSVELFTIPLDAKMNKEKMKHFYTLPKQSDDFFAISAGYFKWSPDGKWVSFLGIPTASWSADSNTLCVLSGDGKTFEILDQMLLQENWMQWAPSKNLLAYIEGEGRFAMKDKHLKIKELPVFQGGVFTPKGFVDWDFTWHNNQMITVARAVESEWSNDPKRRPLPVLYQVNIQSNKQERITDPPKGFGDFNPIFLKQPNQLMWVRTNRETSDVWIANPDGRKGKVWIKDLDTDIGYYEKRDWNAVLGVFSPAKSP